MMREVALPRRPGVPQALPAPALRRTAAAHRAGDGVRQPAAPDRPRRAHDRPRRDDPVDGPGHRPRPRGRARRGRALRDPRPGGGGGRGHPRRGDVRRPHRRARAGRRAVRVLRSPLHASPGRCDPASGRRPQPGRHPRSRAVAGRSARPAAPSRRAAPCASTSARLAVPDLLEVTPDHALAASRRSRWSTYKQAEYGDPVALPASETGQAGAHHRERRGLLRRHRGAALDQHDARAGRGPGRRRRVRLRQDDDRAVDRRAPPRLDGLASGSATPSWPSRPARAAPTSAVRSSTSSRTPTAR